MSQQPQSEAGTRPVVARSFLVRALLEDDEVPPPAAAWHGFVTDLQTGVRSAWQRPGDISRFVGHRLAAPGLGVVAAPGGSGTMSSPALADVVSSMLAELGARLPAAAATVPVPNVTLEQVVRRPVGLGDLVGSEPTAAAGARTIRGGRLDARVRFQVWAATSPDVDAAMLTLHSTLLDDTQDLRSAGFLKLAATGTTLAEHVQVLPAWRKATSFDVVYEYRYADADDAASLLTTIPVTTGALPSGPGASLDETEVVTGPLVRWDDEAAPPLVVRGPTAVTAIGALAWVPGTVPGGSIQILRTTGGAPAPLADLDAFLAAVGGTTPTHTEASVTLAPSAALAALGAPTPGPSLGDWDVDAVPDSYAGHERLLDAPIVLPTGGDRLEISYTPPPGPATGLDQTAVVYLHVRP
ncbi:hypothetical protein [Sanguibacter sp. 25GB23B1]|uniref:hypothetical protein n=1 Tax=unclassified Sanguibacter TaxID=2645534 RepID=UPI0032AED333